MGTARSSDITIESLEPEVLAARLRESAGRILPNRMMDDMELRHLVRESPVKTSRGPVNVSISVGVAHFDGHAALSGTELMERADLKLYEAKRAGRNCVCS